MTTDELLALHRRLAQQQRWLDQLWREADGEAQVVVQLLRVWVEGAAVASELKRRLDPAD